MTEIVILASLRPFIWHLWVHFLALKTQNFSNGLPAIRELNFTGTYFRGFVWKKIFAEFIFADSVRKKPHFVDFLAFFRKIFKKIRKNVISRNLFSRIWQNKNFAGTYFRGFLPKKPRK